MPYRSTDTGRMPVQQLTVRTDKGCLYYIHIYFSNPNLTINPNPWLYEPLTDITPKARSGFRPAGQPTFRSYNIKLPWKRYIKLISPIQRTQITYVLSRQFFPAFFRPPRIVSTE